MPISLHKILLMAIVGLMFSAFINPECARAKVPEAGRLMPFPNAPFAYRYEAPEGLDSVRGPQIVVMSRASGAQVARYDLGDASFCEGPDDNCSADGIIPMIAAGLSNEPVLVVIAHVGAHGQRLSVFRPQADAARPVFEAIADYALSFALRNGRLAITVDRVDGSTGSIRQEQTFWPSDAATLSRHMNP